MSSAHPSPQKARLVLISSVSNGHGTISKSDKLGFNLMLGLEYGGICSSLQPTMPGLYAFSFQVFIHLPLL